MYRGYTEKQGGVNQATEDYKSYTKGQNDLHESKIKLENKHGQNYDVVHPRTGQLGKKKERPMSPEEKSVESRKQPRLNPPKGTISPTYPLQPIPKVKDPASPTTSSCSSDVSALQRIDQNHQDLVPKPVSLTENTSTTERPAHPVTCSDDSEPPSTPEQQRVLDTVMEGRNVFFTGSAGTGKTTTMRHLIRRLKAGNKKVDIIAPTGRSALAIGGTTDFTYARWIPDLFRRPLTELESRANGKVIWKRLNATQVLIVDEVSLIENLRFERLNRIMKAARHSDLPFGGVQLIVTGDWCQLPPIKPFQYCITCGHELETSLAESQVSGLRTLLLKRR